MLSSVDRFLNSLTMYRLLLYGLSALLLIAGAFTLTGDLPFSILSLAVTVGVLVGASVGSNKLLAYLYKAPVNVESSYITALILACLFTPTLDVADLLALAVTAVIAMASKYVLAVGWKHIFNPAAFGVFAASLTGIAYAGWWIGSAIMVPFTFIFGFLIIRKIRREGLGWAFMATAALTLVWLGVADGKGAGEALVEAFTSWPIVFFGAVMLTEPLTTPSTKPYRLAYGVLVGILFASRWEAGPLYANPATALVLGNLFSFAVSPKWKAALRLTGIEKISANLASFHFSAFAMPPYKAGQYLEWTLPHAKPDGRGNRRYFTIASSPTEPDIQLGVKFYEPSSTFKKALRSLAPGGTVYAAQVAGDFTLPDDPSEKLAFIAGGIGVTPFRSMLKYVTDMNERRDIAMLYAISSPAEIAYKEVLEASGAKVSYVLGGEAPAGWTGRSGYVNAAIIQEEIPDYKERTFYVSGPDAMVRAAVATLKSLGVTKIRKDYFPGY